MTHAADLSSRIAPAIRIVYLAAAILVIYMAATLNLRHPLQITMNVLAPIPLLLLSATNSYRSISAKFAVAATLLLILVLIAQPFLHPKPWRF